MRRSGALHRNRPLLPGQPLQRTADMSRDVIPTRKVADRPAPARKTGSGFPAKVKLAVRSRAGNGDPDQARCEACSRWLGRNGGQVHHRQNRQMGGSRTRNGIQNASLLCGDPYCLCHGEATALTARMRDAGFVLNSGQDPAEVPIRLHGGPVVWLTVTGGYSTNPPEGASA